jgi:hypothetical protein
MTHKFVIAPFITKQLTSSIPGMTENTDALLVYPAYAGFEKAKNKLQTKIAVYW